MLPLGHNLNGGDINGISVDLLEYTVLVRWRCTRGWKHVEKSALEAGRVSGGSGTQSSRIKKNSD